MIRSLHFTATFILHPSLHILKYFFHVCVSTAFNQRRNFLAVKLTKCPYKENYHPMPGPLNTSPNVLETCNADSNLKQIVVRTDPLPYGHSIGNHLFLRSPDADQSNHLFSKHIAVMYGQLSCAIIDENRFCYISLAVSQNIKSSLGWQPFQQQNLGSCSLNSNK